MVVSLLGVVVVAAVGDVYCVGAPNRCDRPIATPPPAHAVNGRLWVSRPVMNGVPAAPRDAIARGAAAYGAVGQEDAVVYAKSGHLIVPISPWVPVEPQGLKRLRQAQQFWLREQGYTHGVRTYVNDAYLWDRGGRLVGEPCADPACDQPRAEAPVERRIQKDGLPEPVLRFEVPPDMPRARHRVKI